MRERDSRGRFLPGNRAAQKHGGYSKRNMEYSSVIYRLNNGIELSERQQYLMEYMIAVGLLVPSEETNLNSA